MKKLLLSLLIVTMSLSAMAQGVKVKGEWFAGVGGGASLGLNGLKTHLQNEQNPITKGFTPSASFYVGKFINYTIGFGVSYQGASIDVKSGKFDKEAADECNCFAANAYFRVADFFVPYVHAGYVLGQATSFASGVGLQLPVAITENIRIAPDFRLAIMGDSVHAGAEGGICSQLSANVGLQFAF